MLTDESFINFNTDQEKKAKTPGKPRILVAPLDWGLGHATRCIPIIRELIAQNTEVWIAAEGAIKQILVKEFPFLNFLTLSGYNIRYPKSARVFAWYMIRQLPIIRSSIALENSWLKKQVPLYGFDAIISDNRFGLNHERIPCIFITHQLTIKSPFGPWSEKILKRWNYHYINRFTECWIPDTAGKNNLAGELSHPKDKPETPVHYVGILSRLIKINSEEKKGHLVILLSGPEPQRSILENKLIDQLVHYNGTADVIRGLPLSDMILPSTNHIRFWNHLAADELSKKMAEAEFIISRSGYTTIMDIVTLQKKSILIPTPGQTEQQYLAKHLTENKIACCLQQDDFMLDPAIEKARNFSYQFPVRAENDLAETIRRFISGIRK